MKKKRAFSLIELVVSLTVISIIAAATIPILSKKLNHSSITSQSQGVTTKCTAISNRCKLCLKGVCLKCDSDIQCGTYQTLNISKCVCESIDTNVTSNCNAGQYLNGTTCKDCPAGTYSAARATSCTPCPSGTYSSAGASSCASCGAGKYLNNGSCQSCPAGSSCSSTAITGTCPAGTYSLAGNSNCLPCPAGTHQPLAGQSGCTSCLPGTYSRGGDEGCLECPAGHYQDSSGASYCLACAEGTYQDHTGQAECKKCPRANYTPNKGMTSCFPAPPGHFAPKEGMNGTWFCGDDMLTMWSLTSKEYYYVYNIGTKKYYSGAGQTECYRCPDGTHAINEATFCVPD